MDLDGREPHLADRGDQCRITRPEPRRVEQRRVEPLVVGFIQLVDHLALDVRMKDLDLEAQLCGITANALVVFGQCHGPKDLDLDLPAHVHARTVDDQNFRHVAPRIKSAPMLVDEPIQIQGSLLGSIGVRLYSDRWRRSGGSMRNDSWARGIPGAMIVLLLMQPHGYAAKASARSKHHVTVTIGRHPVEKKPVSVQIVSFPDTEWHAVKIIRGGTPPKDETAGVEPAKKTETAEIV